MNNNNNFSSSFGKSKSKEYKIPRKHKTQNPQMDDIIEIFEFGSLDFL
jgi:hypothetical protein